MSESSHKRRATHYFVDTAYQRDKEKLKLPEKQTSITIEARHSHETPCLQAVDYFLWALQRIYERREDRYLNYLQEKVSLIIDIDDTRHNVYGTYYTKKRPLRATSLPDVTPPGR